MKLIAPGKFLLRKCGREIQTLCRFNAENNIFNRFVDGNNFLLFLPIGTPFEAWRSGKLIHEGWDDLSPFMTQKYGTVGANHGSPFTYCVTMTRHWYFEQDIGKVLTDDAGNRFILVQVTGFSTFIIHSDIVPGQLPCFNTLQGSLYDEGRKLDTISIKKVQLGHTRDDQLLPHFRFNRISLTADGKTVQDNTIVECSSAKLSWDVDLCLADSLLEHIKAHPGRNISPTSPELPPAIHLEYEIVFKPECACTVDCRATFMQDIAGSVRYGLLQHYGTIGFPVQEKLVPGLKPFEMEHDTGVVSTLDFNTPTVMKGASTQLLPFFKSDCLDPEEPPRRYVDIFGDGKRRRFGIAIVYSATHGITAKGSSSRGDCVFTLPPSNKIYPYAFLKENITPGETFHLTATRQYFDPEQQDPFTVGDEYE